jgi:hypothetical protein
MGIFRKTAEKAVCQSAYDLRIEGSDNYNNKARRYECVDSHNNKLKVNSAGLRTFSLIFCLALNQNHPSLGLYSNAF